MFIAHINYKRVGIVRVTITEERNTNPVSLCVYFIKRQKQTVETNKHKRSTLYR